MTTSLEDDEGVLIVWLAFVVFVMFVVFVAFVTFVVFVVFVVFEVFVVFVRELGDELGDGLSDRLGERLGDGAVKGVGDTLGSKLGLGATLVSLALPVLIVLLDTFMAALTDPECTVFIIESRCFCWPAQAPPQTRTRAGTTRAERS